MVHVRQFGGVGQSVRDGAGVQAPVLPLALRPLRCHDVRLHRLEHEPQARRQADVSLLQSLYIYIIHEVGFASPFSGG